MKKIKYLALNTQKEINIEYYKVDTEETVNKLFFKQYGKYPQMIINISECGKIFVAIVLTAISVSIIKGIENHNLTLENHNLKTEIKAVKDKLNKVASDGTRHRSPICAKQLAEIRWGKSA